MNTVPVITNNCFDSISFGRGKKLRRRKHPGISIKAVTGKMSDVTSNQQTIRKTAKKVLWEQIQKSISKKMRTCWDSISYFLHDNSVPLITVASMLALSGAVITASIIENKKKEEAQDYIEQTDYNRYIDMCIKAARNPENVHWIKTANMLKDSIATVNTQHKLQEDSLRNYNNGLQDDFEQASQEAWETTISKQ